MADGAKYQLAKAYVQIIPSLRGAEKTIEGELNGAAAKAGASGGAAYGGTFKDGLAASLGLSTKAFDKIGSTLTNKVSKPLAIAATAIEAYAISTASLAENTQLSFSTMLGGEQQAIDMMQQLSEFAIVTPFQLSDLYKATKLLLAYGFAAEDVIPLLTDVGNAAAAFGGTPEVIDRIIVAIGQIQAKSVLSAEEFKQLAEAGIPAWQYLAEYLGSDVATVMHDAEEREIDSVTAIAALRAGIQRDFGGMMEKQAKTLTGIMSNLDDAIQRPLMTLKDTEGYAKLEEALRGLMESAQPFVESLLPALENGLEVAAGFLNVLTSLMDWFSGLEQPSQEAIERLVLVVGLVGPLMATVTGVGNLIKLLSSGGMAAAAGGMKAVGDAIGGTVANAGRLGGASASVRLFAGQLAGVAAKALVIESAVEAVGTAFLEWWPFFKEVDTNFGSNVEWGYRASGDVEGGMANFTDDKMGQWEHLHEITSEFERTDEYLRNVLDFGPRALEIYMQELINTVDLGTTTAWVTAQAATVAGGGELDETTKEQLTTIFSSFEGLPEEYQGVLREAVSALVSGAAEYMPELVDVGDTTVDEMVATIRSGFGLVMQPISMTMDEVERMLRDSSVWAAESGHMLGWSFATEIERTVPIIREAAANAAGAAADYLHHSTPKLGPLHGDDTWGAEMVENITGGMMSKVDALGGAAKAVAYAASLSRPSRIGLSQSIGGIANGSRMSIERESRDGERSWAVYIDGRALANSSVRQIDRAMGNLAVGRAR